MAVKFDAKLRKLREEDSASETSLGALIAGSSMQDIQDTDVLPFVESGVLRMNTWGNIRKKRVDSQASSATITPETTAYDIYVRTAQAVNLTINNHSTSAPNVGDMQQFIITDDGVGSAKTLTYGALYVDASGLTRPTVLISGKCTKLLYEWRLISGTGKWDLVALNQEA